MSSMFMLLFPSSWGCGAVGSASEWHSEGQGFESLQLHQNKDVRDADLISASLLFCPRMVRRCYHAATGAESIREPSGPTRTSSDSHEYRSGLRLEDGVKKNCQYARIGSVVRDLISGNLFVFILLVVIIIFWRFGCRFGWFAVPTIALL